VEIQNQDSHFPTAPISLRREEESISKKSKAVYTKHLTPPTDATLPYTRSTLAATSGCSKASDQQAMAGQKIPLGEAA
jgi:hypothetical protein